MLGQLAQHAMDDFRCKSSANVPSPYLDAPHPAASFWLLFPTMSWPVGARLSTNCRGATVHSMFDAGLVGPGSLLRFFLAVPFEGCPFGSSQWPVASSLEMVIDKLQEMDVLGLT